MATETATTENIVEINFNPKWAEKAISDENGAEWILAEARFLSSLLHDWSTTASKVGWSGLRFAIKPEHFYTAEGRFFYETMVDMRNRGVECSDPQVFLEECSLRCGRKVKTLFQAALPIMLETSVSINYWAKIILEHYLTRKINEALHLFAQTKNHEARLRVNVLEEHLRELRESDGYSEQQFVLLHQALSDLYDLLIQRTEDMGKEKPYVPSGYNVLDAKVKFGNGHLIVIGGRSGMGKTTFAMNLMRNMILQEKKVGFFALETTTTEAVQMLLAIEGKVDYTAMDDVEQLTSEDFDRIMEAQKRLFKLPMAICERPRMTIEMIRAEMEGMKRTMEGLDAVFIDHMHIIGDDRRFKDQIEKLTFVTAELKGLAKEFKVPVIALAQMNRDADKRPDKRPQVSDLKGSGTIEQDADSILFVYRDSYYANEGEKKSQTFDHLLGNGRNVPSKLPTASPLSEVICKKNRHGKIPQFTIHFAVDSRTKCFTEEFLN